MKNEFYQGEDIELRIEAYKDDSHQGEDLSNYDAFIMIYSGNDKNHVLLSTVEGEGIQLSKNGNVLSAKIPHDTTVNMEPGTLMMEIKLVNKENDARGIVVRQTINIKPSRIGKL